MTDKELSLQRAYLAQSSAHKQETTAYFILSCATMAYDLLQMCKVRRMQPYPEQLLEDPAAYILSKIEEEFEKKFGHSLFQD